MVQRQGDLILFDFFIERMTVLGGGPVFVTHTHAHIIATT